MAATAPPESPILSLRIERRGGFAGLKVDAEHDLAALSPAQQRALAKLVVLQPGPGTSPVPPAGADRLRYRLSVLRANGQQQVLDVAEPDWPDALSALSQPSV